MKMANVAIPSHGHQNSHLIFSSLADKPHLVHQWSYHTSFTGRSVTAWHPLIAGLNSPVFVPLSSNEENRKATSFGDAKSSCAVSIR
jgi:hypothetical protein